MAAVMGWGLRTLRVLDRREQTEERRSWRFELSFFQWAAHSAAVTAVPSKECLRFPICAGTSFALLGDKLGAQPGNHSRPKAPGRHRAGAGSRGLPGAPTAGTVESGAARPHREPLPPLPSPPARPPQSRSLGPDGLLAPAGPGHSGAPFLPAGSYLPRSAAASAPLRCPAARSSPARPYTFMYARAPTHAHTLPTVQRWQLHRAPRVHHAPSTQRPPRTRRGDVTLGDMANGSVGMGWRLDLMMLGVFSNCKDSMTRCDSTKSNSELMPLGADIGHSCMDLKHTAQSPVGVQQPTLHCPCVAPGVLQPQTCHKLRAHPRRPQHPQPRQAPRGTQGS